MWPNPGKMARNIDILNKKLVSEKYFCYQQKEGTTSMRLVANKLGLGQISVLPDIRPPDSAFNGYPVFILPDIRL